MCIVYAATSSYLPFQKSSSFTEVWPTADRTALDRMPTPDNLTAVDESKVRVCACAG